MLLTAQATDFTNCATPSCMVLRHLGSRDYDRRLKKEQAAGIAFYLGF